MLAFTFTSSLPCSHTIWQACIHYGPFYIYDTHMYVLSLVCRWDNFIVTYLLMCIFRYRWKNEAHNHLYCSSGCHCTDFWCSYCIWVRRLSPGSWIHHLLCYCCITCRVPTESPRPQSHVFQESLEVYWARDPNSYPISNRVLQYNLWFRFFWVWTQSARSKVLPECHIFC